MAHAGAADWPWFRPLMRSPAWDQPFSRLHWPRLRRVGYRSKASAGQGRPERHSKIPTVAPTPVGTPINRLGRNDSAANTPSSLWRCPSARSSAQSCRPPRATKPASSLKRNQKFVDSPPEGDGFELLVPRHESPRFPKVETLVALVEDLQSPLPDGVRVILKLACRHLHRIGGADRRLGCAGRPCCGEGARPSAWWRRRSVTRESRMSETARPPRNVSSGLATTP